MTEHKARLSRRNRCGVDAPGRRAHSSRIVAERIGIYGGTFDPVHTGHLLLGRDAVERLRLSRLIFVPAAISPHKLDRSPGAPGELRLRMLRAAVAGEPRFAVDAANSTAPARRSPSTRSSPCARGCPQTRVFYLIGEDNLPKLHTWHRIDELRRLVTFVVFRRGGWTRRRSSGGARVPDPGTAGGRVVHRDQKAGCQRALDPVLCAGGRRGDHRRARPLPLPPNPEEGASPLPPRK